jgi:hypothetical protein
VRLVTYLAPLVEALEVHVLDGALAFAGRDEATQLWLLTTQTYLALLGICWRRLWLWRLCCWWCWLLVLFLDSFLTTLTLVILDHHVLCLLCARISNTTRSPPPQLAAFFVVGTQPIVKFVAGRACA